jgi:hypothetical protein
MRLIVHFKDGKHHEYVVAKESESTVMSFPAMTAKSYSFKEDSGETVGLNKKHIIAMRVKR